MSKDRDIFSSTLDDILARRGSSIPKELYDKVQASADSWRQFHIQDQAQQPAPVMTDTRKSAMERMMTIATDDAALDEPEPLPDNEKLVAAYLDLLTEEPQNRLPMMRTHAVLFGMPWSEISSKLRRERNTSIMKLAMQAQPQFFAERAAEAGVDLRETNEEFWIKKFFRELPAITPKEEPVKAVRAAPKKRAAVKMPKPVSGQDDERPVKEPRVKKEKPELALPDDATIILAAVSHKTKHGILPTPRNGAAELPEGSATWWTIIRSLSTRELSVTKLIERNGTPEQVAAVLPPRKEKPEKKPKASKPEKEKKAAPEQKEPLTKEAIIDAALGLYKRNRKLPTTRSGHDGLPEGSDTWGRILHGIHTTEKKTIAEFIQTYGTPEQTEQLKKPAKVKAEKPARSPLPENGQIVESAIEYLKKFNRLPNQRSDQEFLPEGTHTWGTITYALRRQDLTLLDFMRNNASPEQVIKVAEYFETSGDKYMAKEKKPAPEKKAPEKKAPERKEIPDDDVVRTSALAHYKHHGHLPLRTSDASCLPGNSLGWGRILKSLADRNTDIRKIADADGEYTKLMQDKARILMAQRAAEEAAIAAAAAEREANKVPKAAPEKPAMNSVHTTSLPAEDLIVTKFLTVLTADKASQSTAMKNAERDLGMPISVLSARLQQERSTTLMRLVMDRQPGFFARKAEDLGMTREQAASESMWYKVFFSPNRPTTTLMSDRDALQATIKSLGLEKNKAKIPVAVARKKAAEPSQDKPVVGDAEILTGAKTTTLTVGNHAPSSPQRETTATQAPRPEKATPVEIDSEPAQPKARVLRGSYIPTDEEIKPAIDAFRAKHNRLPAPKDKKEELPENSVGWSQVMLKLRRRGLTLSQLLEEKQVAQPSPPATQSAPVAKPDAAPTMAERIIRECANRIAATQTLPSAKGLFNCVAGMPVPEVNRKLRAGEIDGVERFANPDYPPPGSLNQLFIDAGLARYEGKRIVPASSTEIRNIVEKMDLKRA